MDKWVLDSQIASVMECHVNEWLTVKRVKQEVKDRFGSDCNAKRVRSHLDSMVVYKELDKAEGSYRGHTVNLYRKAIA